jgi:hypothetical protein
MTATQPEVTVPVPRSVAARPRRQPRWIAAGVLAICLGALGAVLLFTEAVSSRTVVMVAADIQRGELVEAADLTTVTIGSTPGVRTVAADQLGGLVGRRATVDLVAGSLLPVGAVGDVPLRTGYAQVGLRLAPGRLPLDPLPVGTPVQLVAVATGSAGTQATDALTGKTFAAFVVRAPELSPDGQTYLLDVQIEAASAVTVAQLAAADRIVLIRQPEG